MRHGQKIIFTCEADETPVTITGVISVCSPTIRPYQVQEKVRRSLSGAYTDSFLRPCVAISLYSLILMAPIAHKVSTFRDCEA